MHGRLFGKVAMVTGAASGIGRSIAERFVAEGAHVLLTDIQDECGRAIAAKLGANAAYLHCDVRNESDIAAAVDFAVAQHGRLDVLVSNAAAPGNPGPIEQLDAERWDRSMEILLRSVVLGAKHAARVMLPQGAGSIISIASSAGLLAGATPHDYSVGKAAVIHFSKGLGLELGERGVRANAICPGYTLTPMMLGGLAGNAGLAPEEQAQVNAAFGAVHPVPRVGMVEDIASMAVFLASDEAGFVNGQAIAVDGGMSAGAHRSGHASRMAAIGATLQGIVKARQ